MKKVILSTSILVLLFLPSIINMWTKSTNLDIEASKLKTELSRKDGVDNTNRKLIVQQEEFAEIIEKIVVSLASNDKQVGIGGVEIDAPGYTEIEVLRAISEEVKNRNPEEWFDNVRIFFDSRSNYFSDVPEIWPIEREHFGRITSSFGIRKSPFDGSIREHNGVDISAEIGTPVIATADGIASGVWERHPTFGKIVYIDHPNGFQTRYAHLDSIEIDYLENIVKGQIIGTVGNTGMSAGAHLHYEIRKNGSAMDPVKFWLLYY